jgi:nickel superoxide dismutase
MIYKVFEALDRKIGFHQAKAHCDIPCGIYDPIVAQLSALTVVRMIDLINDLESKGGEHNAAYMNSLSRYIAVKEEHAEKAKSEIRIIWGDFIKQPQIDQFPGAHELVHKIMQLGSKSRQTIDRENALQFVEAINQFADFFWKVKGVAAKRVKYPMAPNLELVYPAL